MSRTVIPSRTAHGVRSKINTCDLLKSREIGVKRKIGFEDDISIKLYSKFDQYRLKSPKGSKTTNSNGGIFNLEFSLDGRLLVAACEHKSVLIYDAGSQEKLRTIDNAHSNCVNCIRYDYAGDCILMPEEIQTKTNELLLKLWQHSEKVKKTMSEVYRHMPKKIKSKIDKL